MKKKLRFLGVMIVTIGVLTACDGTQNNKIPQTDKSTQTEDSVQTDFSTPEETLEAYMETVKAGEIEKSKDFIHGVIIESYTDYSDSELIIDKPLSEKIKLTDGYKEYEQEIDNTFNQIEYEVTSTYEIEGGENKEFTIDLKMKNLYAINEQILNEIKEEYAERIKSTEDESSILESFNKMYAGYAKDLRELKEDTMSGYLGIYKNEPKEEGLKKNWMISAMDYGLFAPLTKNYKLED